MTNLKTHPRVGGGRLPSLLGKNIKFWRGEGNIMDKREKGSIIVSPMISILLGRISRGVERKGTEISVKNIKILKNVDGEEYQGIWNFIHPCSGLWWRTWRPTCTQSSGTQSTWRRTNKYFVASTPGYARYAQTSKNGLFVFARAPLCGQFHFWPFMFARKKYLFLRF